MCSAVVCSKHLAGQCVLSVKCMSYVMYCVTIIKYSVFDLRSKFVFFCLHYKIQHQRVVCIVSLHEA